MISFLDSDAIRLLSDEKTIAWTQFKWSASIFWRLSVIAFHSLMILSWDSDVICLSSDEKTTAQIEFEWSTSVWIKDAHTSFIRESFLNHVETLSRLFLLTTLVWELKTIAEL